MSDVMRFMGRDGEVVEEPVDSSVDVTLLNRQISEARAVVEMMQSPGWAIYHKRVIDNIAKVKDGLIEMDPKLLVGLDGVGAQHLARGMMSALAEVAGAISIGAAAEKRLGQLSRPAPNINNVARLQPIG